MKKILLIGLCLLAGMTLCGCGEEKADMNEPEKTGAAVTCINETADADIWIIPDTEANRKTSLWGAAAIKDLGVNESAQISLDALGGPGLYLFRAIDADKGFYGAEGVFLDAGYTLRFTAGGGHPAEAVLEILDADGNLTDTWSVFVGVL